MQFNPKIRWTEDEITFLKFAFPNQEFTDEELERAFPNRTWNSIRSKANCLGVKRYTPPKPPQGYKKCYSCDTILPLTFFNKNKNSNDGLAHYCRICRSEKRSGTKTHQIVTNNQIVTKKCKKCNSEKPLSEFYKHPTSKGGYRRICKVCHSKERRIRYIKGGY